MALFVSNSSEYKKQSKDQNRNGKQLPHGEKWGVETALWNLEKLNEIAKDKKNKKIPSRNSAVLGPPSFFSVQHHGST